MMFFFLSRLFLFDYLKLVSFDELYFFDGSDNNRYRSRSPGKSVGSAGDVSFGNFVPTVIESLGNVALLIMLVSREVGSKVG